MIKTSKNNMHGIFGSEADAKLLAVAFSLPDFSQWQVLYRALSWSFQLTSCLFGIGKHG